MEVREAEAADVEVSALSGASTTLASFEVLTPGLISLPPTPKRRELHRSRCRRWVSRAFVATLVSSLMGYIAIIVVMSHMAITAMVWIDSGEVMRYCAAGLTTQNLAESIHWPGCGNGGWNASCARPCYSVDLLHRVRAMNLKHPGQLVKFSSRPHPGSETVELAAWYMPAPPELRPRDRPPPRVVVQHGFTENSNYFRQILFAYMLRSAGIDVIVNNFRDHCYSANSTRHIYEWGHAYPYDLLGAWDYARTDPDGIMGGEIDANLVGLAGFSKGGFTTLNAFGLEVSVPAVWVDGSPFTPSEVFAHGARQQFTDLGAPNFLAPMFVNPAWRVVMLYAKIFGVDLTENMPANSLPRGPDSHRPVYVVHNRMDGRVPIGENTRLMEVLLKYPEKYDVQGDWVTTGRCHGNGHCMDHLRAFDDYFARLCHFYRGAFAMDADRCADLKRQEAAGEWTRGDVGAAATLVV